MRRRGDFTLTMLTSDAGDLEVGSKVNLERAMATGGRYGGHVVQVGREIVKVIDPASMRFEGQVSADRLSELKVGQLVSFRVNGFGDQEFKARLSRIDAAANATTQQVEVAAVFEPGASVPQVAGLYA